jgi:hypothetical protein
MHKMRTLAKQGTADNDGWEYRVVSFGKQNEITIHWPLEESLTSAV